MPEQVRYIGPGGAVSVRNVQSARTFAPGDVVDLDAEAYGAGPERPAQVWRDVLGHVLHLFEAVTSEAPVLDSPDDFEE